MESEKKTDGKSLDEKVAEALFTEEDYEAAWENAGPLARARFAKKGTKTKYRMAYYEASYKTIISPLTGKELKQLDKTKPYGLMKRRLPPGDLHKHTKAFVEHFKTKGAKTNEKG